MQRVVVRLAVGLAMLILFAISGAGALAAGSPNVVISQVYGGGGNSGATLKNDYIQLYNRGTTDVPLSGWTVQYASAAGTSWSKTALSGTIPAGGSYLIQESAGTGGTVDLVSPDATGTIAMSATAGKVALVSSTTALSGSCPLAGAVDFVGFGSTASCFEGTGPTPGLSNTTAAIRAGGGTVDTDNNAADFTAGTPAPRGSGTGGGGGETGTPLAIHAIQGASQVSPVVNTVVTTTGIVTAVDGSGFYLQDPQPDADPATSEGIYVFGATSAVGNSVSVTGRVSEFIPGGTSSSNLPTTEISGSPFVTVISTGNPLPAATIAHPPTEVIEDDASGDVRTSNVFDPAQDGLDYWESLEGMLVQVNEPVAVGPQNSFGELPVVGGDFGAGLRTPRGGVLLTATDQNPERIILDDQIVHTPAVANVGDTFTGPAVGVLSYNFGNFMLELTAELQRVDNGLQREVTAPAGPGELSVATFNVENLDVGDGSAKFDGLADRIVHNLLSPKIVALEEVQDNDGPTDDGVVESNVTLDTLVHAIEAAGGPSYSYTYIAPVNDQDGGEPGGNIRIAFLYDEAAGVSLPAGATTGGSTDANTVVVGADGKPHLSLDPGRIAPGDVAWDDSRKPLAGEFLYRGRTFFVIGNHFDSKGGDQAIEGRFQPPTRSSEVQRHQQATLVHDFVGQILAADPSANIVVLGDLNDFQFSDTVHILEGGSSPILFDMIDTLPANEQYSYEFEGNAQVLDHILVSKAILDGTRTFDVVHINAEFADQLSDHDPSVLKVLVESAPTASIDGPSSVAEGGSAAFTGAGSDADGDPLTTSWTTSAGSISNTGVLDASTLDGPGAVTITLTVSDGILTSTATKTVQVDNVAPTATLVAPASVLASDSFAISLTGASDSSAADMAAGLEYAFDCGTGTFGAWSSSPTATCPTSTPGTLTVRGSVRDKDGAVSTYTAQVTVSVTVDSLCALVTQWAKNAGQANSLCVKLRNGQIAAFDHEVDAQTGKAFTADQAATLKALAAKL